MIVAVGVTDSTPKMLLEALYRARCPALDLKCSHVPALGCKFARILVHTWCVPIATVCCLSVLVRYVMLSLLVLVVVWNALVMLMMSVFNEFTLLLSLVDIV